MDLMVVITILLAIISFRDSFSLTILVVQIVASIKGLEVVQGQIMVVVVLLEMVGRIGMVLALNVIYMENLVTL